MEQTLFLEKVRIIVTIKFGRAATIHLYRCGVVTQALTFSLQERSIGGIQRRVLITFSREIIKPVTEGVAMAYSNCVSSYIYQLLSIN